MTRWLLLIATAAALLAAKHATAADFDLVVCRPDAPCFVKYRFDVSTACDLDLWSVANVMPKGTKIRCVAVRNHKEAKR
jgi:hypothetical protein